MRRNTPCHCPTRVQAFQNAEERREELKQQMAVACSQLLRAPEEHTRNLRALLALTVDADTEVWLAPTAHHCAGSTSRAFRQYSIRAPACR